MVRKINGREITPLNHRTQHQNGGEDEINVGGLSGRLADPQNADAINGKTIDLTGIAANKILQYDGEKFVVGDKAGASGAGDIAVDALWVAKGDIAAAAGAGSGQRVAVGSDPWMQLHPNAAKGQGLEWMPPVPALQNRVLRILDGAASPNTLTIHQCYIPFFRSVGFSQENLNGIICGGHWIDQFQACQPLASNVSRGGLTPNDPGTGVGAASLPHVVPWTDIDWNHARAAIENRGGAANKSNGGTPVAIATYTGATDAKAEFLVANEAHLIGRRVEIVQDGVTYFRRVIKQGLAAEAKYLKIYPDLPADLTTDDTYTIVGHHMMTPDEQFSLAAWSIANRYRYGLGHCKGNTDYGKSEADARAAEVQGLQDPVLGGDATHDLRRCLTGSGPLSWSLNGQANGVWDLVGNVWEWNFQQVVTDGSAMVIAPGYPGAGTVVTPPGASGQKITALYDTDTPADGLSLNAELCFPDGTDTTGTAEYGYDGLYYNIAANTYAARRGGVWYYGSLAGLFALYLDCVPTSTLSSLGFRGAF